MNLYSNWIILAEQYLKTSRLVMEQIVVNQNKWFMIDDEPIPWEKYLEETKWSDFNTFVPSLFLLIHGLELLLKGMVKWSEKEASYDHNVSYLIKVLSEDRRIDPKFINIVSKYIGDNPTNSVIHKFLTLNENINSNKLHVNIRYPQYKTKATDFSPMRYKEKNLINEIKIIIKEVDELYKIALEIIRTK